MQLVMFAIQGIKVTDPIGARTIPVARLSLVFAVFFRLERDLLHIEVFIGVGTKLDETLEAQAILINQPIIINQA